MMRKILSLVLCLLAKAAFAAGAPPIPPSAPYAAPAGIAGNGLVNFLNKSLQHSGGSSVSSGGHKTIFYVGNSTAWNPGSYYAEWCSILATSNVLTSLGLTPCTTGSTTISIQSYTANNSTGSVTVALSGTPPSAYAVGDLVLSEPTNATLNTMVGTGVITSIGASSVTYQLLNTNGYPSNGLTASSGGYLTNSLLNLGGNGQTSTSIKTTEAPFVTKYALPGDLILVRGPIINDVRLGLCNLSCAVTNITTLYNALPSSSSAIDIAWKTENSLLTTDPTSSGYVSPLSSSQAYTKIIHDAVFQAFLATPQRAVVWDNMQLLYSKLGQEYATSACMIDILHPQTPCQIREAEEDEQILSSLANGNGIPAAINLFDPYASMASNSSYVHGAKSWIQTLQAEVNYSPMMAARVFVDNYATPWTRYPDVVLDPNKFDVVGYGTVLSAGTNYVRYSQPAPSGGTVTAVLANDLIWFEGSGVIQLSTGFSQGAYNGGGTVYGYGLSGLGSIVPASVYIGQHMAIFRQRSYNLADIPYLDDPVSYPFRPRVIVTSSGTNYLRLKYVDGTFAWPSSVTASDVLDLPCGIETMTGATFGAYSTTQLQINLTGSWASCANQVGWLFGTHLPDSTAGVVNASTAVYSPGVISNGTTFTIASGCGTPTSLTGGSTSGSFAAGQAACAPVIGLPTAPNGWYCEARDLTTPADLLTQTAKSTSSCTLSGTVVSGDTIVFRAQGY
jgi:hypothetical protein